MKRPTILLVEDNPDHITLTILTLAENDLDCEIIIAKNGQSALDYIFSEGKYKHRSTDDLPMLVLLDLGLPGMSGMQVMNRLRNDPRTFFLPIMMLTSANERFPAVLAFKGDLTTYISKPLQYREFEEQLKKISGLWHMSAFMPLLT